LEPNIYLPLDRWHRTTTVSGQAYGNGVYTTSMSTVEDANRRMWTLFARPNPYVTLTPKPSSLNPES
jgi:hypothetical protein